MRKVLLDRLLSGAGPEDFLPEVKKEIQEAVKDDALMLSVVESCSGTEKLRLFAFYYNNQENIADSHSQDVH